MPGWSRRRQHEPRRRHGERAAADRLDDGETVELPLVPVLEHIGVVAPLEQPAPQAIAFGAEAEDGAP